MRRSGNPEKLRKCIKRIAQNSARLERKADKLRRENRKREADLAAGVRHGYILRDSNAAYSFPGDAPDGGVEARGNAGAWSVHCFHEMYYNAALDLIDSTNDTITSMDIGAERKAEENKELIPSMCRRLNPELFQRCSKRMAHNAACLERKADKMRHENRKLEADLAARFPPLEVLAIGYAERLSSYLASLPASSSGN
jgi:hypothetical protein